LIAHAQFEPETLVTGYKEPEQPWGVQVVAILRRAAMSEHQPHGNVRKLHLLARETIERQKQLLTETDQLLRDSRHLISRTQELIRETQHVSDSGFKETETVPR